MQVTVLNCQERHYCENSRGLIELILLLRSWRMGQEEVDGVLMIMKFAGIRTVNFQDDRENLIFLIYIRKCCF